jgi:hypothetical protein
MTPLKLRSFSIRPFKKAVKDYYANLPIASMRLVKGMGLDKVEEKLQV